MGGWVGGATAYLGGCHCLSGGWPESDNKTISVQLDLTWTGTGTELGNKISLYVIIVIIRDKTYCVFVKFY